MSDANRTVEVENDVEALRQSLERTQAAYVSIVMEKNFLERALADFNFHQNAHDGIVYTDQENRVVYANPYFLEMMQVEKPEAIMNQPLPDSMWRQPDQAPKLFEDVRKNGFVRERELFLQNRNGEAVFAMCSSVASKDKEGNFIGTELMFCNVTSKRRLEADIAQRQNKLERALEFARSTVQTFRDLVEKSASRDELKAMLSNLDQELSKLD